MNRSSPDPRVRRIRVRHLAAAAAIGLISGLVFASPALERVHGLSLDFLTALRWRAFGAREDPASAPAVVVAIDEESYLAPPFRGSPTLTWTREIGRVLTAVIGGGAKVVGFDVVFPTSIEQSEIPFGDEPLGARVRGFDRDYLRALALAAGAGKVVLGEVQHRDQPIRPSPGQRIAVGQQRNIRALNAYVDRDEAVRRLPLTFMTDGRPVPSMALELAARALGVAPHVTPDGGVSLAGYRIPSAVRNTFTLNFEGGAEDIPTYSLADLRACVERGDGEFFRRNFDGKVVLIGTLLDIEDRRTTSKRFATGLESAWTPRCVLSAKERTQPFARDTIAGVYIHATGVNNLIRRNPLTETDRAGTTGIAIAFACAAAVTMLLLAPISGLLACVGLALAYTGGATFAFTHALALPLVEPLLAGLAAMAATVGYRFTVADRDERFLRKTFALYLAPQVIDNMIASNKLPQLGGEMRDVTVFFSDIANFSSFSEIMTPAALVELMNEYLSAMTDIIEDEGGYVDKYIGDSIVAMFGAPAEDRDHARHAVDAALRCRIRLHALNEKTAAFRGHKLAHRIGLNSGEALVGNIGSRRRFNYTVMSDAVNLASRLEGANKFFATSIIASEATVARTGGKFAWRELDAIRVKGRAQPVRIFDPLAPAGKETREQAAHAAAYAEGLRRWRARDFAGAVQSFSSIAEADPPAAMFLARARALALNPPGSDWEPVCTLEAK